MKKALIIIALVLTIPTVFAKESLVKYKYYKINRIYGPYSDTNDDYPYFDSEDFIYSDYTESLDKPEEKDGREILTEKVFEYERVQDVNYISFINYTDDVSLKEVTVKYKGEIIEYETDDDLSDFKNSTEITLYLKQKVDPTKLEVFIKTNKNYSNMAFIVGCDGLMYAQLIASFVDEYNFMGRYTTYNSTPGIGDIWTSCRYDSYQPSSRIMRFIGNYNIYKYRDKLYHTYKEEREYYGDYLTGPIYDYTYKDEDDYIIINDNSDDKDNHTLESSLKKVEDLSDISSTLEIIDVPNTGISYNCLSNSIINKGIVDYFE